MRRRRPLVPKRSLGTRSQHPVACLRQVGPRRLRHKTPLARRVAARDGLPSPRLPTGRRRLRRLAARRRPATSRSLHLRLCASLGRLPHRHLGQGRHDPTRLGVARSARRHDRALSQRGRRGRAGRVARHRADTIVAPATPRLVRRPRRRLSRRPAHVGDRRRARARVGRSPRRAGHGRHSRKLTARAFTPRAIIVGK